MPCRPLSVTPRNRLSGSPETKLRPRNVNVIVVERFVLSELVVRMRGNCSVAM